MGKQVVEGGFGANQNSWQGLTSGPTDAFIPVREIGGSGCRCQIKAVKLLRSIYIIGPELNKQRSLVGDQPENILSAK